MTMKFKMNAKTKTIKVNENRIDRLFKCASTPHLSMYKGLKKNKKNFSQSEKFMYICLVLAPPLLTENCMKFCDCTHARAHLPRTNICWHGSVCECLCVCVCACVCVRAHHLSTRLAKLITSTCGTHNKLSSAPLPRSGSPHPPASSSEHRVEVELELVYMNVDVIGAVSGLVADVANAKGISSGSTRASISMYRTSGQSGNRCKGDIYCGTPWCWRLKRRILLLKALGLPFA